MRILFLIGIAIVIVGALPMVKDIVPNFIPTSGNNYQYLIMILGGIVGAIGLTGQRDERGRIAKMLGFKGE